MDKSTPLHEETVCLHYDGDKSLDFPIKRGTLGPNVVDVRSFAKTGMFTYDPGFLATASCTSAVTYIDGEQGLLYYRGYPIEQLAEHSDYLEVCYLLLNGELPSPDEKEAFDTLIRRHTMLHAQINHFYQGFRRDAHPMAVMVGVVGALSAFYHDSLDINNESHRKTSALRLIAKMPTIAAQVYRYNKGLPFSYPQNHLGFSENFLHMMFSTPCESYTVNPVGARALDLIFTLHADHEQNASTSTVRLAGSSGANPFACVASGIACLWGPAHGGANEAVLKMLIEIGDESRIGQYIARAKDASDPFKLMGFGHRVYKNMDPRAAIMRRTCKEVLEALGLHEDPLFKLAMTLEKIALEDAYFVSKKLYPNIDFYSGIVLSALKIPLSMFTPIFALARTVGWIAHWTEMISDPKLKIGRPRQLYTGAARRDYVPLETRGTV